MNRNSRSFKLLQLATKAAPCSEYKQSFEDCSGGKPKINIISNYVIPRNYTLDVSAPVSTQRIELDTVNVSEVNYTTLENSLITNNNEIPCFIKRRK